MRTATLASILLGIAVLPAQDDREFGTPVQTTLTRVRAEPHAYRNVKVTFVVQFASLGRISNPFFTKFTPSDFANFYVWGDEQEIWQQKSYEDLFGALFLSKFSPQLDALYQLQTYDRIRVTGIVRNTFQDMPWIEATEFEKVPSKLDTAVLTHLYRGEQFMQQRLWQRAIAELSLVPGGAVPQTAMLSAYRNLGTCLLRIGEVDLAKTYLQSASSLAGGRDRDVEDLLAIAENEPSQAIDRTVDSRNLKDFERPMWEAFEGGQGQGGTTMMQ
ncbi:MAG: hypothetical protein KDE27_17245 [Planctomycetes bacterium]|nr:hypothetical protein [Planctomycetota bacterium]